MKNTVTAGQIAAQILDCLKNSRRFILFSVSAEGVLHADYHHTLNEACVQGAAKAEDDSAINWTVYSASYHNSIPVKEWYDNIYSGLSTV